MVRRTLDQVQQFYRTLYFGDPGLSSSTSPTPARAR
jgi:hypothetical protein